MLRKKGRRRACPLFRRRCGKRGAPSRQDVEAAKKDRREVPVPFFTRGGDFVAELGRGDGVLGVSAVGRVAREAGRLAEVFLPPGAELALAAGVPQPGDAHSLAEFKPRLRNRKRRRGMRSRKRWPEFVHVPTIWWPGMTGIFACGRSPSITCRSVRQTAQQRTRIRTSPGPGSGVGTSAHSSGADSTGAIRRNNMAFMAFSNVGSVCRP